MLIFVQHTGACLKLMRFIRDNRRELEKQVVLDVVDMDCDSIADRAKELLSLCDVDKVPAVVDTVNGRTITIVGVASIIEYMKRGGKLGPEHAEMPIASMEDYMTRTALAGMKIANNRISFDEHETTVGEEMGTSAPKMLEQMCSKYHAPPKPDDVELPRREPRRDNIAPMQSGKMSSADAEKMMEAAMMSKLGLQEQYSSDAQ